MMHSFDVEIAAEYGINAAILLQNLDFWIAKNKANKENYIDGRYWTYNSIKAYKELFPYLSERQINTALKKLVDEGLIITGNYNKMAYDHTLWYAITDKGQQLLQKCKIDYAEMSNRLCKNVKSNMQKCKIDYAEMSNRNSENVKPIPDINTDINTDINKDIYTQVKEKFCEICISLPKIISIDKTRKATVKARLKEYSFDDIITVFQKAEKSDFLTGKVSNQGSRPFKASFDWLMKPSNFIKVLEGNYDNRNGLSDFGLVGADERYRGIQIV